MDEIERWLLIGPEHDLGAVLLTEHGGQRKVVAVDVGDQEAPDVTKPCSECAQMALQHFARHLDRPAAVHHGEPVVGLDDVDVHSLQAVHGQRQRDPVDALGDLPGPLGRPVPA